MGITELFKALLAPPPSGLEGRADLRFEGDEPAAPLTSAFLKLTFEDPECEMLLLAVLSTPAHKRKEVEHMAFTAYLMGLVEMGIRGELTELRPQLEEEVKAQRAKRAGKAGTKKKTGKR